LDERDYTEKLPANRKASENAAAIGSFLRRRVTESYDGPAASTNLFQRVFDAGPSYASRSARPKRPLLELMQDSRKRPHKKIETALA